MQNFVGVFRMRQNVKSKGAFYEALAAEVEAFDESGGPAAARAARFVLAAVNLAFHQKLIMQRHSVSPAVFRWSLAVLELE